MKNSMPSVKPINLYFTNLTVSGSFRVTANTKARLKSITTKFMSSLKAPEES